MKKKLTILPSFRWAAFFALACCMPFYTFSQSTYDWAKRLGNIQLSSSGSNVNDLKLDASGNIYVTGSFAGTSDFDPDTATANMKGFGGYFAKYNANGDFVFAKTLTAYSYGYWIEAIEVDNNHNIYVAGRHLGMVDLDPGPGSHWVNSGHSYDVFFAKYDSSGNFIFAKSIKSNAASYFTVDGIALDNTGNIFLTGSIDNEADFDPGVATVTLSTISSYTGAYIAKYNASGDYVFAHMFSSPTGYTYSYTVATDNSGNCWFGGLFKGTIDLDAGAGDATFSTVSSYEYFFIAKYDPQGNYLSSVVPSGSGYTSLRSLDIDAAGNIYATGGLIGTNDVNPSAGTNNLTTSGGGFFMAKYSSSGSHVFSGAMGGTTTIHQAIAADASGNCFITGIFFDGTMDFNPGGGTANLTAPPDGPQMFLAKYNSSGSYVFAKQMGAPEGTTFGHAVTIDPSGNPVVGGYFQNTVDFNPDAGVYDLTALPLENANSVIGKYSTTGALIWAKAHGSNPVPAANAEGASLALDTNGNVYVAGKFKGIIDMDPGTGTALSPTFSWGDAEPAFFGKYTAQGSMIYGRALGANAVTDVEIKAIATDLSGNLFITGDFGDTVDFDPGPGTAFHYVSGISNNVFLAKYDANGNFVFAKAFNDAGTFSEGHDLALDNSGNIYVTGRFNGTVDFDPGVGVANLTASGIYGFIAKYDNNGNYLFAKNLGGSTSVVVTAIHLRLDANNNIYVSGNFRNTIDFDPGAGVADLTNTGGADIFIAKYDAAGNYVFARQLENPSTGSNAPNAIAVTDSFIYICGSFNYTTDFDPGTGVVNLTSEDTVEFDAFFAKYDLNGNYIYAKSFGDAWDDEAKGISVDVNDNVYVTGYFTDTVDFDLGAGSAVFTGHGVSEMFLASYDRNGNYRHVYIPEGPGRTNGNALVMDNNGDTYVTGLFRDSTDFDNSGNASTLHPYGQEYDAYIVKLNYDVCMPSSVSLTASICSGESYFFNGANRNTAGTYYDTLSNAANCDSLITLNLTINQPTSATLNITQCFGSSYSFNNQNLTTAGTYYDTLTNAANCDSLVTLNLSFNSFASSSFSESICYGESYSFNNQSLTASGAYKDTLNASSGCDSIVTLNLTVNNNSASSLSQSICSGSSYSFNGQNLTASGSYKDTVASENGCDSIITLNLAVTNAITTSFNESICDGESYSFNNQNLTTSGAYKDTLTASAGCDSIVTLNLTVNDLPQPTITQNGDTLSTGNFSSYQWLLNGSAINNATSQQLHVTQNGDYSVIATDANGCSDTSAVKNVTGVGISEFSDYEVKLYPNPNSGTFILEFSDDAEREVVITDMVGRTVLSNFQTQKKEELSIHNAPPGIYFLQIKQALKHTTLKFVVSK